MHLKIIFKSVKLACATQFKIHSRCSEKREVPSAILVLRAPLPRVAAVTGVSLSLSLSVFKTCMGNTTYHIYVTVVLAG